MTVSSVGLTGVVADFVVGYAADEDDDMILRAVLDTIAVAGAAATERPWRAFETAMAAEAGTGRATVWLTGQRTSPGHVALLNGTAAHLLEFDDVAPSIRAHPSAVLVPAVLAVAEEEGSTWAEVAAAYGLGAAVLRALALALPSADHYVRGWHTAATVGAMAATCSAARLMGLDAEQVRAALGIACSLTSGMRVNFGTDTKALHTGWAARSGVLAAGLARRGFLGSQGGLEDEAGFFDVMGERTAPVPAEWLAGELDRLRSAWRADATVKLYPTCYATHRAIDLVRQWRTEGVRAADVASVRLAVQPGGTTPLISGLPHHPEDARLSIQLSCATALVDGNVTFDSFGEAARARPEIVRLMNSVEVYEVDVPPIGPPGWRYGFVVAKAALHTGRTLHARRDHTSGDGAHPATWAELEAKFDACAGRGVPWRVDVARVRRQLRSDTPVELGVFVSAD